ncbi:hypothetical protein AB4357_04610 [Vibrio lentus]
MNIILNDDVNGDLSTSIHPDLSHLFVDDDPSSQFVTLNDDGTPRDHFTSDLWDFSSMFSVGFGAVRQLRWTNPPVIPKYIPLIKRLVLERMKARSLSVGSAENYQRSIYRVIEHLGSSKFHSIRDIRTQNAFLKSIKDKNLSVTYAKSTLYTVEQLSGCFFTESVPKLAEKLGVNAPKQAVALPERMSSELYDKAIKVVEHYHPYRHQISQEMEHRERCLRQWLLEGKSDKGFSTYYKRKHPSKVPEFEHDGKMSFINSIQTACFIVTVGFSGLRDSEAKSVNKNSYEIRQYLGKDIPYIYGETTKSNEQGNRSRVGWVTHPIVKKALELATDMSEFARNIYREIHTTEPLVTHLESAFISMYTQRTKTEVVRTGLSTACMKQFLAKYCSPATEQDVKEFDMINQIRAGELVVGGHLKKFTAHDLRRTAAMFIKRNGLASVGAMKSQFKHLNALMTDWYSNGAELAALMDLAIDRDFQIQLDKASVDIAAHCVFEIYNSPSLSGKEGKRIKETSDYQGRIKTLDECRRDVQAGRISIVEHPTGYCCNPTCTRICADEKSQVTCNHEVVTRDKAEAQLPKYQRLINTFKKLNTGQLYLYSVLIDHRVRIQSLEKTFDEHCISYLKLPREDLVIKNHKASERFT